MSRPLLRRAAQCRAYICAECRVAPPRERIERRTFRTSPRRPEDNKSILSILEERGYINQLAGDRDALDKLLQSRRVGFYAGIDPTAPSLHLGHLLPLMVLFWLYHHGHHVVSLIGGATARVGDPSGRLTSRTKTDDDVHGSNNEAMSEQVQTLWDRATVYGLRHGHAVERRGVKELLNNETWLKSLNILDFLQTMGNGARVGTMLGRDTVRNKMEKGDGMSFAEFTYPLLQGWDWWQMFHERNIQVQVGGGDQYGNIVAGMDAVRHLAQAESAMKVPIQWFGKDGRMLPERNPIGLTVPLLTTSSGEKFGKSAGNAVWLDSGLTSAFDLYGFLLKSTDDDVERYLKLFTFLPIAEISSIMTEHNINRGARVAQHLLASEVLELVHGREEAIKTRSEHQALRNPSLEDFANRAVLVPINEGDAVTALLPVSLVTKSTFSRLLYHAGIVESKSAGARKIAMGGVYVASSTQDGISWIPVKTQTPHQFVVDGLLLLRLGKWKVRIIKVIEDKDFDAEGLDVPGYAEWKAANESAAR